MKILCFAMVILFSLPSPIRAETAAVTLQEAIGLALSHNSLVKAAEFEKTAAGYEVAASRSRYFPRIFLDESFTATNSPTRVFMMKLDQGRFGQNDFLLDNLNSPSSTGDFSTALTLEQPLFDMGIVYGNNLAETEAEGKNLALARRREEIGFMVYSLCLDAQKAKAAVQAAEQAVGDAREHLRLAKAGHEAGTGLKSDELRALTFLAEMEQQEITARNNVLLAAMRLSLVTGGKPTDTLDIRETIPVMPLEMKDEDYVRLAGLNRKDHRELETEAEKARVGIKMAGSAFLPTIYGSAAYRMHDRNTPFGRDNDAWIVGASLRWELFDGMRRFAERGRSAALHNAVLEQVNQHSREIVFQVRESLLRREEAEKRLQVAHASALHAEEGVRLITKRFANSLATMVEVLDAQTAWNRARVNLVENETNFSLATAKVWYSAGIFLKEVMK